MKRIFSALLAIVVAVSFLGSFSTPNKANALSIKIDLDLQNVLKSLTNSSPVEAVITFREKPDKKQFNLLQKLGLQTKKYKHLPMVGVKGTKLQILNLLSVDLGADAIYYNEELEYKLNESRPLIGAERVWKDLGYTGKDVTVAVIDSGIDATRPDLPYGEKVVQNVKFLTGSSLFGGVLSLLNGILPTIYFENVQNTDTTSGHGTHVAGTIAGNGNASEGEYEGIAPDAKLIGLGVGEAISILWALEAFDWVLENQEKYGIDIISNSWGSTGEFDPENPINIATKVAHDAGMVVVFAAGNEGPSDDTINPYSTAPWVISVGAGTKDKQLADFSSRGVEGDSMKYPDIVAPGVDIIASRSSTGLLMNALGLTTDAQTIELKHLPYYTTSSGTSMAAPHISGVAALMLEANQNLSPDRIKQLMQQTADPMPGYKKHEVGAGYVNAYEAVKAASRQ